ncbi:alpha/beta fold hydrolase [Desertibacillus haloalkaliphilus]|uniref:alpha/beta fold hydrolase n=1 Tax=Desertibacillus haloalkaliphilus TaxID=1328930 RepID=UPI001C274D47|nr:alpha/beta hydrolase [Desertibacillus haloalkaliphilus]MBU8905843.1 alpha/beta hydrolase [Desertibacillus haloalkaliphilus]
MPYAYTEDAIPIYYEAAGHGVPIIFIHSPALGHVVFKKQRSLASDKQVITYDLRGNGRSGSNDQPMTMPQLTKDVLAVLNDLEVERAVICGYSNGCSVALEFALSYPERTEAVILCGGFPEVNSFLLQNEFKLGIYTSQLKAVGLLANVLAKAHCKTKEFEQELRQYVLRSNPNVVAQQFNEGLHYQCTNRLTDLKKPLLLVYGRWDVVVPHYRKLFLERVDDVEVAWVSKATHQIPTKHADEFNHIIRDFIERKVNA